MSNKPELLAPAGDMERLEMSLHYGADAVYLAGREFGMRAAAGNFSDEEMHRAVALAHEYGAKVHVTCNTLPREDELKRLPAFLEMLQAAGADALIIADMGVFEAAKKYAPSLSRHVSTQLGIINSAAAAALYNMGADRIVLARETSLSDIAAIRVRTPPQLELEAFVHGAMCVSFSGRCLLSNYLTGRDANRGECAQPCRWKYRLVEEKRPGEYFEISEDGGTHILNSRDLCMIEHIPEMLKAGITSFKIEGRMKSAYYAAAATNAYRRAIDAAVGGESLDPVWVEETELISHRPYSTGFYFGEPGQHCAEAGYCTGADVCAVVEECDGEGNAILTQRNKFSVGDTLDLLTNDRKPCRFTVTEIFNEQGESIDSAPHPMMQIKMKLPAVAAHLSILRRIR